MSIQRWNADIEHSYYTLLNQPLWSVQYGNVAHIWAPSSHQRVPLMLTLCFSCWTAINPSAVTWLHPFTLGCCIVGRFCSLPETDGREKDGGPEGSGPSGSDWCVIHPRFVMTQVSVDLKPFSNLPTAAVCNGETTDCSYVALMKHLNLTSSSELSVMRPVKHWATPTVVLIDMLLDGILEVVSVYELLCDFKGGGGCGCYYT